MNRTALVVALTVASTTHAAAQRDIDVGAIDRDLAAFGTRLETLRSAIDQSRFEPDAMVDSLDYDADALLEFVRSDVVYQPYEGTLRGAAGTLRARAGNSLDQSVLLAYLLKTAGFDARIASGKLAESDALRLLRQTRSAVVPSSLDYLSDTVDEILPAGTARAPGVEAWSGTALYADAKRHTRLLREALARGGIALAPGDAAARWLPVVERYFWVQYREGPADEWQDAHPAFGAAPPPGTVAAEEYLADTVPAKYQHTLTMSAWIEQWQAGKIAKHRVMDDWSRPTANLNGVALSYRNAPSGLSLATAAHLDQAIAQTSMLVPMFNGALAPGARVFDLNGQTVDPFALSMGGAANVFQTLGEKLAGATGAVMDRGDGQPALALHSMYLEFKYTAPSGQSETRRRYLLAPRADHRGEKAALVWPLITDHTYMVATGAEPIDFVADRFLNAGRASLDWLDLTVHKAFEPDVKVVVPAALPDDAPPLAQYWLMAQRPLLDGKVATYRAAPGLLGIRRGYRDATTTFAAVDVVFDRVEHLRTTAGGLEDAAQEALATGVWDTVLESVPGRTLETEPRAVSSTTRVFDLAAAQGIATVVLKPGDPKSLEALGLDANTQRFVRDDLERGLAVVIPQRVPDGARISGWWRVHPQTGETLGMTGDGYGSEVAEYLMDVVGTSKGLVDSLNSIIACENQANDVAKLCCLVEAHINNVAGLGFGGLMGATLGTTTATVFDIMNTAATGATGQGLMPSANLSCDQMEATEW